MLYDAILCLGVKLGADGAPTQELCLRVEAAARCWQRGKAPMVIACGGRTEGTPVSEAEVMALLLLRLGVPPTAIHMEARSLITQENIANAKAMLHACGGEWALVVTSDYHMARALYYCKSEGLRAHGHRVRLPKSPETRRQRDLDRIMLLAHRRGWDANHNPVPAWALERLHVLVGKERAQHILAFIAAQKQRAAQNESGAQDNSGAHKSQ